MKLETPHSQRSLLMERGLCARVAAHCRDVYAARRPHRSHIPVTVRLVQRSGDHERKKGISTDHCLNQPNPKLRNPKQHAQSCTDSLVYCNPEADEQIAPGWSKAFSDEGSK
jgi:hypothetical protein